MPFDVGATEFRTKMHAALERVKVRVIEASDGICPRCKAQFRQTWSPDDYCSDACRGVRRANRDYMEWKSPDLYLETDQVIEPDHPKLAKGEVGTCPTCRGIFTSNRNGKSFCSRKCQKNSSRGSLKLADNTQKQRDFYLQVDLLTYLNEAFYEVSVPTRVGMSLDEIKEITLEARYDLLESWLLDARHTVGKTRLRDVFCNPVLRVPEQRLRRGRVRCADYLCYNGKTYCPPVTHVADEFCRKFYGCRVFDWVDGTAPDPVTGEVMR